MLSSRDLRYQPEGSGVGLTFADVDLPQGSTLLLGGPAGSGKSTWLALAAGLLLPGAGQIAVAGTTPGTLAPAARASWRARTVGLLPQTAPLHPALTVRGNLALPFFALGLKEDRWAIQHVMAALHIEAWAKTPVRTLAPQRARRVALARALLLEPPVLLLDEPLAGLAPDEAANLLPLLKNWVADKACTLVLAARDTAPWLAAFDAAQVLSLPAPSAVEAVA